MNAKRLYTAGFSMLDVENAKLWAFLKTDRALSYTQQHNPPHQTVLLSGTFRGPAIYTSMHHNTIARRADKKL